MPSLRIQRTAAYDGPEELTEDDVAEIGSAMTQIEKKRLQAALREQADADADELPKAGTE